jgi:chromosome partitioning protein
MILTVGNTKGGVGKTTLALNIAIARALAGKNVWLIDADTQDTAKTAIAARAEAEIEPTLAFAKYPEAKLLRSQVKQQAGQFDDVIIDVGGRDTGALRASIFMSNVLLIPFEPSTFEVWAMEDIAKIVAEARDVKDDLIAYAVLNCGDTSHKSTDNKDAVAAIAELPEISLLPDIIYRRKTFSSEGGCGKSVLEAKRKDKKAIDELNGLMAHLFPVS